MWTYADIAKMIDHALLHPTLTLKELQDGCRMAVAYDVASVCIMPYAVPLCAEMLAGSTVKVSTTIGFPHGGHETSTKVFEASRALGHGAHELDMVVNISRVKSGHWADVRDDISAVTQATHEVGQKVKVIFENAYLTDEEKIRLCEICTELNVDWVKTSTGFASTGATTEDLVLMRRHAGPNVEVKAAGGVRDLDRSLEVRQLGVTRIGTSGGAKILDEARELLGLPRIDVTRTESTGY